MENFPLYCIGICGSIQLAKPSEIRTSSVAEFLAFSFNCDMHHLGNFSSLEIIRFLRHFELMWKDIKHTSVKTFVRKKKSLPLNDYQIQLLI